MKKCTHDYTDKDVAIFDGLCPICLSVELYDLKKKKKKPPKLDWEKVWGAVKVVKKLIKEIPK